MYMYTGILILQIRLLFCLLHVVLQVQLQSLLSCYISFHVSPHIFQPINKVYSFYCTKEHSCFYIDFILLNSNKNPCQNIFVAFSRRSLHTGRFQHARMKIRQTKSITLIKNYYCFGHSTSYLLMQYFLELATYSYNEGMHVFSADDLLLTG